jgi:N-acetylneuraminate synthase
MRNTFIIAEAGVNHNGQLDLAKKLIDHAREAGADAVKFQTFQAAAMVSRHAQKADYQRATTGTEGSQLDLIRRLQLDEAQHEELVAHAGKAGISFLSTPFDIQSADLLLKRLGLSKIKIGSGDLTNGPLLLYVARSGAEIILSTGIATLAEIETALAVCAFGYLKSTEEPSLEAFYRAYHSPAGQEVLGKKVTLLHCTTAYPAPYSEINLRAMDTLRAAFGLSVGYSDHSLGLAISTAAVALGATIIEKHFTLDRKLPGPDHRASLEPDELRLLVDTIRHVEEAMGNGLKIPSVSEKGNKNAARKSLVAACPISKGEVFSADNLTFKRPGSGISPFEYWRYLGRKAERAFGVDDLIQD